MPRQHSRPFLVSGTTTYRLEAQTIEVGAEQDLSESSLQQFLFQHPEVLPVEEIEPVFAPLIPLCRELPTNAGSLDLLYASSSGLLTLVECKLWKNPEARREVVGQILDYAKEISHFSYADLQQAVAKAGGPMDLYRAIAVETEDIDESSFIDEVTRNLRRGRFLLLIVGEGIRESVHEISEFLQTHAHLNFAFALVEMAIFNVPQEAGGGKLIAPRVLCRTVEIERAVVRVEDERIVAEAPPPKNASGRESIRRTKISEQVFYETVDVSPETVIRLKQLLGRVKDLGLIIEAGSNSVMIKTADGEFNFATFRTDGTMQNYRIAKRTKQLGFPEVGERYLDRLAGLFDGGTVDRSSANLFRWTVRKDGRPLTIDECLDIEDAWLDLLQRTLAEIEDAMR